MNAIFQHLEDAHMWNAIHLVVVPTGYAEAKPEAGVSLAFQINARIAITELPVNLLRLLHFVEQIHNATVGFVAFCGNLGERFVVIWVDHEFRRRQQ